MPYPSSNAPESEKDAYVKKFMESAEAKRDYPDTKQRVAVALSLWRNRHKKK